MHKSLLVILLINLSLSAGCTWVHLTPQGENIRAVTAADVVDCKKLGETKVSLLDKVAGFKRSATKVKGELLTLGRNSAAEMKGDTIVPISEVKDGEQTFAVYKCINP